MCIARLNRVGASSLVVRVPGNLTSSPALRLLLSEGAALIFKTIQKKWC